MARPAASGGTGRFERKLLVAGVDPAMIRHMVRLHPAHFREIHQARFVNNCYFDRPGHSMFRDAVQGHTGRLKVRVRWYGDLFGHVAAPVVELKRKSGQVGTKQAFPLPAFHFDRETELPRLSAWFVDRDVPLELSHLADVVRPTLVNRYSRRYLLSADSRYRLTMDTGSEFYEAPPPRERARRIGGDEVTTILELKYDGSHDQGAREITSAFPFRLTKSSKYVTGVARLGVR